MEKHWELNDEGLSETFESLPPAEKLRLMADADRNLEEHTQKMCRDNDFKRAQIEEIELLMAQKRALLERMRAAAGELAAENARIELDVERVLARAA